MFSKTKKCSGCERTLPVSSGFYKDKRGKQGVDHYCKECRIRLQGKIQKRRQTVFKKCSQEILHEKGCEACGTFEGRLEFHHIDPETKVASISQMTNAPASLFKIELKKTSILCTSCHVKVHHFLNGHTIYNSSEKFWEYIQIHYGESLTLPFAEIEETI